MPERRAQRVKCELLPCFNGGECIQKKFCDCSKFNASGSRCQIVYNTGADRENICRTWGQYHFETFDGLYYYYPGRFTYDLLRHSDPDEPSFAIQIHNDPDCFSSPYSCMRSVSLYFAGVGEIKLHNRIVLYNNARVELPHTVGNVKIQAVSGYIIVRQQYAFSLAWDGQSSVYLKMSPEYLGRTRGLCGNNNWTPQDDLVTSYGKMTENIEEFVNSWREDFPSKSSAHPATPLLYEPPCAKANPHVKQMSYSLCSVLHHPPFHSCHNLVSPFPFMASCTSDLLDCSVTGDFHITTFDGRKFTFQAPCQYILAKSRTSREFTVSVQSAPCGQNLDGSCIQSINLILDQDQKKQVTLTQAGDVLMYDQYKINLPYTDDVFAVRRLSSVFVQVKTAIGLQLLYDRQGLRLYVRMDGRWKDNTAGLCGTFNDNTQDDFLSPVGVPESTPQLFGHSWKTSSACRVEYPTSPLDPCDVHLQAALYASESCSIITRELFAPCHLYLSPVSYYEQCRRDTCNCGEECLCSALAHYAYQCRNYGIVIDFSSSFPICELSCENSMVYGTCVTMSAQTCQSLSALEVCDEGCFEGCACPEGMYLNTELDRCVERSQCPCYIGGMDYQPGENIITSLGRCQCKDGVLSCESSETALDCQAGLIYYNCSRRDLDIELRRERTCENQLLNITASTHLPCISGCVCPQGLVKHGNECFPPDACPCSWKAKEYFPGEVVNSPCHTCICHHGSFQCSFQPCPAMCTFYGDRHFRTFDGLAFDFLGTCKVQLVKALTPTNFSVMVENVNCYSAGIICRKIITISVGQSQILFSDESGNPSASSIMDKQQELHIWQAGFFTFVHFPLEDITVLWDQRTTIHVQVGPQWQGLLSGLCGNFDVKTVNEMRTPESSEVTNPQEFGNSWVTTECADSLDTRNPCTLNPLREPFAKKECAILLSDVFEACHPVVDVTWFYSNCLSDTCGCNRGGDCECFCTSVSAYAHQCCQQGISVDWRSPRLCPYDCEFYNKVLGKGPYQLHSYLHPSLVLSVRLSDTIVIPLRGDGTNFMLTPGLYGSHDQNLISLELADRPNYFLYAAKNGSLLVAKWRQSQAFRSRSTFLMRQNAWIAGYSAFESFANPGHFLRLSPTSIYLSKYRHSTAYRRSSLFKLSEVPVPLQSPCQWRYDACSNACFRTCSDPTGKRCTNVPKVEGCIPQCPPHLVLDEVTRKCVYFPDCIEPALGVTTIISSTVPQKPTSGFNVTRSPGLFSTPPLVTPSKDASEGNTTSRFFSVHVVSSDTPTLLPRSQVATDHGLSTVQDTISTVKDVTSSPGILAALVTTINRTELSSFLSPETALSTSKVTKTMYVTSKPTIQVPTTQTVPPISPGEITDRIIPTATSPGITPTLTDHTPVSALPNVPSMALPALVTTIHTSKSVTATASTQLKTTVPKEHIASTGTFPASSETQKVLHSSTNILLHPVTGPSMTRSEHSYSQPALAVSLVPSSLSPLHSSTSTPYSLVSSSGLQQTHVPSTNVLTPTRGDVPTPESWQSTAQTYLFGTKLVTSTDGDLPSSTSTSTTKSATTKVTDRPVTEAFNVTTEPSTKETIHRLVTSPSKTSKYSPVSTDLTRDTSVGVAKITLSAASLYTVPTPTKESQHLPMFTKLLPSTISETFIVGTSIPTLVASQSFRTTKAESTISTGVVGTSFGTTGPSTTHVSLYKPSADLIYLSTKPQVTEKEHTQKTMMFVESVLEPNKTTLRPEVASHSSASIKVHKETVPQEVSTSPSHLLPPTEKSTGIISTKAAIHEISSLTASLKLMSSTKKVLLPTDTSIRDTSPSSVHTYPTERLSQLPFNTGPTQKTFSKASSSLTTKNVTTLYVPSSAPFSTFDEASTSVSVPTSKYHVTDTSQLTESASQQAYSAISPSLSPAVSYSTTQLAEPETTKEKVLLTHAINTTYSPSSLSPLSTRSMPDGSPTESPSQLMTASVLSNMTESVKSSTEKTTILFVSAENITGYRALSTAESYKTTSQLISASQPSVVSETLARNQPTIKESKSLGLVSKGLQTSSVAITRDTVTGTLQPVSPPDMAYPSPTSQHPPQTGVTSQHPPQTGVTSQHPPQTGITSHRRGHLPASSADRGHLPASPSDRRHLPASPSDRGHLPASPSTGVTSQHPPQTGVTSQHPPLTRVTSQHPPQSGVTSQHPPQTGVTSPHPTQTGVTSPHPPQTNLISKHPLETGVTPEIIHHLLTLDKTTAPKTLVTSSYPIIAETSQAVTSQTRTSVTSVLPLPVTHNLNITTNQTGIQSPLFSTTSQMPTEMSISSTIQEVESSFLTELAGMTMSAMLPSRESATPPACTPYTENDCIKHICVDGQLIQVNKSQHCPYNVTQPSCGLLGFAVQINGDRCCPKWECACRCSVFSDLSFVTFDGRYLALYKEASYIALLTEEESITVQVSRCGDPSLGSANNVTLCLSMLELTYLSNQIIIDRLSRKVAVNSRNAWPMVRKYGYRIVDSGNMYFIETPSNIRIQWFHINGLMIIESNSTTKPPSMGLCGLCDGNTTNDLILPNGRVLTQGDDSDEFLDSWQVPYTLKYVGKERRQDLNCSVVDCSPCFRMIVNQTFSSCHPYVSPDEFCEMWAQDTEYNQDPCKALTTYTAMCHKFNICIEWRNSDFCPFPCPESLIYRPCLAVCDVPQTCQNDQIDLYDTESCSALTETCVCPEGTILHRLHSTMCVPESKCACTDSSGTPREIGETWNTSASGCCMYKCAAKETIIPVHDNCTYTQDVQCHRYGEVTIAVPDNQTCCPRPLCICNQSLCDSLIPTCAANQKLTAYHEEDSCCPRYTCECDPEKCGPSEEPPLCRDDQMLFLVPVKNSCCIRHICGCNICVQDVPTCQEGEILTIIKNSTHRCCPTYQCVCDRARCPDATCDLGMSAMEMWTPGSCCPYRTCECSCEKIPKPECDLGEKLQIDEEFMNSVTNPCNCTVYKCVKTSVCLSKDGGILRPGQTIIEHTSEGVCTTLHCTSVIDPISRYHKINVSSVRCAANCNPNQVYEPPKDVSRCCGHCRNVSCIQNLLNGTILTHRPGSSWIAKCLRYDCTNTSVGPVLMTSAINCPPFNETECIKMGGYVVSFLDGCCKTCKEDGKFCKRVTVRMTIRKNDCRSNTPVNIVSCDGKCPSASIYNYNINTYARFCKCCRELGLQRRVVQLYCTGNSTWVNYSIQEPTDCSCQWS
ncbi:LOW QUALITY PROTEIN: otogelin [Pyxicephalus adspersus]|uniref:LOW QUALITY PROTEIN: otogelin n=1 Tax=Pyxicephalus adspersus TaxID=30357 RepID=UPI003B5B3B32